MLTASCNWNFHIRMSFSDVSHRFRSVF